MEKTFGFTHEEKPTPAACEASSPFLPSPLSSIVLKSGETTGKHGNEAGLPLWLKTVGQKEKTSVDLKSRLVEVPRLCFVKQVVKGEVRRFAVFSCQQTQVRLVSEASAYLIPTRLEKPNERAVAV